MSKKISVTHELDLKLHLTNYPVGNFNPDLVDHFLIPLHQGQLIYLSIFTLSEVET